MLKKIIGTFGTRIGCAFIGLLVLIFNARCFGASGTGSVSLFVLDVSILQIINSIIGGSSLVYMLQHYNRSQLLFLSYLFSIVVCVFGSLVIIFLHLVPSEFKWQLMAASLCYAVYFIHTQVMLSEECIARYNMLAVSQILVLWVTLMAAHYFWGLNDISLYANAHTFSFFFVAVWSCFLMPEKKEKKAFIKMGALLKKMMSYGIAIQLANLAQLLNYRLSYFIIKFSAGLQPLGLFDMGTKISESVWLLPKSVATVQYARITHAGKEKEYAVRVSIAFFKLSTIFSMVAVGCILCIPASWISAVFGSEFGQIKPILYILAWGIVALSANMMLAHYFAGRGQFKVNTVSSIIGLLMTALCSIPLFFIPMPGMRLLQCVSFITICSYTSSFIYTFYCFCKDSGAHGRDFLPVRQDFELLKTEIRKMFQHA
ncbi:MAG: lipopolysaccharide biosynthesis protein [Bacteroidales bacterium]|nr:lipopolysaccharide biosynthesis protein [Bacteroidales bacterium]